MDQSRRCMHPKSVQQLGFTHLEHLLRVIRCMQPMVS